MAGQKRLYLYWDPAIGADFQRQIEAAFGRLNVVIADGETADIDPEEPGLIAVVVSSAGGWAPPAKSDIVIQAGPGEFPQTPGALRLTLDDVNGDTPRWGKLVERLRAKLGVPSLALSADQLEEQLNATAQRADEAERNMSAALLNEANAIRDNRQLRLDIAAARERIAELEQQNEHLETLNRSGRFAIGAVPENLRGVVSQAREFSRRAELAAARAAEAADAFPDQISFSGATYSGQTRDEHPDGHGVMTFMSGKRVTATYRGEFAQGKRSGLGVGSADESLVWSGQWADDQACGFGILEAPDGRRFEGKVEPGKNGPRPVAGSGWQWNPPDMKRRAATHHAVAPSLPAPNAGKTSASS